MPARQPLIWLQVSYREEIHIFLAFCSISRQYSLVVEKDRQEIKTILMDLWVYNYNFLEQLPSSLIKPFLE